MKMISFGVLIIFLCATVFDGAAPQTVTFKNVNVCFVEMIEDKIYPIYESIYSNNILESITNKEDVFAIKAYRVPIPILYEHSITDLGNVRLLFLNHVNLREIEPNTFGNIQNLTVNLEHNEIKEIKEHVFTNVPGIIILLLSHNRISMIHPHAFNNMTDLTLLKLSFNRLKHWDSGWLIGSPVMDLYVNHNCIKELPPNAFRYIKYSPVAIEQVMFISFESNNLTKLENRMIEDLLKVKMLRVDGNPLEFLDKELCKNIIIEGFEYSGERREHNCMKANN